MIFNTPLLGNEDEYICRFTIQNHKFAYNTMTFLRDNVLKCFPPILNNMNQGRSIMCLSNY